VFLQVRALDLEHKGEMFAVDGWLQVNTSGEDSKSGCAVQVTRA
jgi:uncharacterized pyridoxal phosphate-containing UPF0001 family protein